MLPCSIKSFSNLAGLCVPALGEHTLPQSEQGPPVVAKILEVFAVHPFGILRASSLEQGCSQIEAHRLRPVGRFIESKGVLHLHGLLESKNCITGPSPRHGDLA